MSSPRLTFTVILININQNTSKTIGFELPFKSIPVGEVKNWICVREGIDPDCRIKFSKTDRTLHYSDVLDKDRIGHDDLTIYMHYNDQCLHSTYLHDNHPLSEEKREILQITPISYNDALERLMKASKNFQNRMEEMAEKAKKKAEIIEIQEAKIKELTEAQLCTLCCDKKREMIFMPCCHMVSCQACSMKLEIRECSVCRTAINGILKVFQ